MITFDCAYEPPHQHEYPDDWRFGGPDGTHPGADPRYEPTVYVYYDESFNEVYTTSVWLCDDEAIDQFTYVASLGAAFKPVYLGAKRPGERTPGMLPWRYDKATDTVTEIVRG